MILAEDKTWTYSRQLTIFTEDIEELDFAYIPFLCDNRNYCVIRRNRDGWYAVFVKPALEGYTPEERAREVVKLNQERFRLETEEEVEVVDTVMET